jgi:hypothetical protein
MSKNRPMSRIDLDYNKDLKYPDINDYLKDSMYASNLTEYPDNQKNSVVNFKAIPNTIALKQITVGQNKASLGVWVADMKLFGYNPELESIDRMELVIDALSDGDTEEIEGTKVFKVFKRGTALNLDLVHNSEIQAYKLPPIVNFSITFPIRAVIDIYDYVFGTRAAQAKKYFANSVDMSDEDFQERFLDNAYRWEIPAMLRYYTVGTEYPSGFVGVEISLTSVLPQYRKKIELTSSKVEFNSLYTVSKFNLFKFSYSANQDGRLRLKAQIEDFSETSQTDSVVYEINEKERTSVISSFYAYSYVVTQHSGYYLSYPKLKFTYDLYMSADSKPELSNDPFDTFEAAPAKIVAPISIYAVQSTMGISKTNATANNSFSFDLWFTSQNKNLHNLIDKLKFVLEFRQPRFANSPLADSSTFFSDTDLDVTTIAGDFWGDSIKKRQIKTGSVKRTNTSLYKVCASSSEQRKVISVFQRLSVDNDRYKDVNLAACSVVIDRVDPDEDGSSGYRYHMSISWPVALKLQSLYNLVKAKFVKFSIGNVFQETLYSGVYTRPFYDVYPQNADNPLYTNLPSWRPNYYVTYTQTRPPETTPFELREQINLINEKKNGRFLVDNTCKTITTADLKGTESAAILLVQYRTRTYLALPASEPAKGALSVPYFCLRGVVMVATQSISGGVLGRTFYYPNLAKPISDVPGDFKSIDTPVYYLSDRHITVAVNPQDALKTIRKVLGRTTLSSGVYYLYYIMNLNEVPDTESKIFTNKTQDGRQQSNTIFVIKHQVK